MRELLLINNEPTPEDRGRIVRAGELGLTDPLYNIDALSAKLSAFGTDTVRHYTQLRTLASAPDAIFLSGCFTDWDRERLRETFADELALIRETTAPLFGICAGLQLIGIAFGAPLVYPGEGYEEFGFLPQTVLELSFVDNFVIPRLSVCAGVDANVRFTHIADFPFDSSGRKVYHNIVPDLIINGLLGSSVKGCVLLFGQFPDIR